MRDRLSHLQEVAAETGASNGLEETPTTTTATADAFSNVDLEDFQQQAVVFDNEGAMDGVFDEAQNVRREIQLIRLDVKKLKEQNSRMLNEATGMSTIKRDSNAIAADIKQRGEGVLGRLHKMDAQGKELEAKHGVNAAVVRVARTQYMCLSNDFRDVMFDYNETEMAHRESCKLHLQRQMEIVGREVTGEEIEEMIESGQWNVFNENILTEGKTSRSALNQIESRHKDLMDLESRIQSIHELFLDVAILVEEQGPMMNTIQANIHETDMAIGEAMVKLNAAKRYDKNNPFKKMFCSCFPCYE